jgi:hypothetical protein
VAYQATAAQRCDEARIDRILEVDDLWAEIAQQEARCKRADRDIMARMAQAQTERSRYFALTARVYAVAAREARRAGYAEGAAGMAG